MGSAKVTFEIEGNEYSLYFGMVSIGIFEELSARRVKALVDSGIENPTQEDFGNLLSAAILIHAGLCNMSEIDFGTKPTFENSYRIAELIANDVELWRRINETWEESKPVKEMQDRLKNQLSTQEKKNTNRTTGTKSKRSHTVS